MLVCHRWITGTRSRHVSSLLLGLLLGSVLGVALRESLFALAVVLLAGSIGPVAHILGLLPWVDPVYTRAALHSLAGMHVNQLSLGTAADAGLVRFTLTPGSSVLGRLVSSALADSAVLAVAVLLLGSGIHRNRLLLICASVAAQVQTALALIGRPPSMADLETVGLSFAVNATMPWLSGRRLVVSDLVSSLPAPLTVAVLVALALASAYMGAGMLVRIALVCGRYLRNIRPSWRPTPPVAYRFSAARVSVVTTGTLIAFSAFAAACESSGAALAVASAPPAPIVELRPSDGSTLTSTSVITEHIALTPTSAVISVGDRWYADAPPPSQVEVLANANGFQYLVNGVPQVIHGMGVNTQYHTLRSPADRKARLDADLSEMHDMGVNTLVGWDPGEFDDVLLNTAQRHSIGVVLPFDLDPDADYTDASVRAALTQQVLAWVQRYRSYPALRMWGLGNEVLHKIVHPAWVGPQDPHQAAEARAFSDWLIETADAIHVADPNHPVTYRDAEDAFVGWVSRALERHPADRRAWFVYGTNCYQDYLDKIVDNWPDQGTGVALWVSEFAPGGLAIPDRPAGFTELWGYVRKHPDWVLGGAVYAWTRNGPEEIDRNLGLTDDGTPADGHSLDAIASLFAENASP